MYSWLVFRYLNTQGALSAYTESLPDCLLVGPKREAFLQTSQRECGVYDAYRLHTNCGARLPKVWIDLQTSEVLCEYCTGFFHFALLVFLCAKLVWCNGSSFCRGLFLTIHDRGHIFELLSNWPEEAVKVPKIILSPSLYS